MNNFTKMSTKMFTNGHRTVCTDLKTHLTDGRAENCTDSCIHVAFLHSHLMLLNIYAKSAPYLVKETTQRGFPYVLRQTVTVLIRFLLV